MKIVNKKDLKEHFKLMGLIFVKTMNILKFIYLLCNFLYIIFKTFVISLFNFFSDKNDFAFSKILTRIVYKYNS